MDHLFDVECAGDIFLHTDDALVIIDGADVGGRNGRETAPGGLEGGHVFGDVPCRFPSEE